VVCRKCERWNLSPLEERWETVESCERLFRDTRVRVSTENIGLARLPEGLELVRIGQPMRPEFAAWRYGDQFGRRRKRAIMYGVGGAAVAGVVIIGGMAAGIVSSGLLAQSGNIVNLLVNGRPAVRFRTDEGKLIKIRHSDLRSVRMIVPGPGEEWRVQFQKGKERTLFVGAEAQRFAGTALPRLNRTGGSKKTVGQAVAEIEQSGGPEPFLLGLTARAGPKSGALKRALAPHDDPRLIGDKVKPLVELAAPLRLATEMALHEEQERRALEGELATLEAAWRNAEEIAAIADDLLVPEKSRSFLERQRPADPPA
jgi:hypothetical protein